MPPALLDGDAAGGVALAAVAGFFLGVRAALGRAESDREQLRSGIEAAGLALLGGLLARTFAFLLLHAAGWSHAAVAAVGTAFMIWPGFVDLYAWMAGGPAVSAATVLGGATLVGALAGLCDGLGRIVPHGLRGTAEFVLDVTWGLAGTSLGLLVHLANLGRWSDRIWDGRAGAHRYRGGFRLKPGFAVTLGSACSNLGEHWDSRLFLHERVHVRQNRLFGPLYPWTYVAWFVLLLPAAVVAGWRRGNVGAAAMSWCYYNNPWEEWAYRVGGWRPAGAVWPTRPQRLAHAAFVAAVALGVGWGVRALGLQR